MSLNDECELHKLVKQTLEKSGSMSKLRAELRADVFLALEENGCFKNLKTKNNSLQEFAKNSDGLLVLCLIREFLDYYGLSFTASVFDPELASYGIECDCKDFVKLGNQLNLTSEYSNGRTGPLLCEMLQIIRNFQNNSTQKPSSFEHPQLHPSKSTDSSTEYYQIQPLSSFQDVRHVAKSREVNFEDGFSNSKIMTSQLSGNSSASPKMLDKELDSSKYSLSSLGDLPPLNSHNSPAKSVFSPTNNSSKQMGKLKAMLMDNNEDLSVSLEVTDDEKENDKITFSDISTGEENIEQE